MPFRLEHIGTHLEFVNVRLWSIQAEGSDINCGVLCFRADEWLAFVSILTGRDSIDEIVVDNTDQILQALRGNCG